MPADRSPLRIVIVGNDDIAAITAAMLSHAAPPPVAAITLLRPREAPSAWSALSQSALLTPAAAALCDAFGQDELSLLRDGRGGFVTGTVVQGFGGGAGAFVPFGAIGEPVGSIGFHHLIARRRHRDAGLPLAAFMGGALCAQTERFAPPPAADAAAQAAFDYALHIDGERVEAHALAAAAARGVTVATGSVALVERDPGGRIRALTTDDGTTITGDLFVDCGNWIEDEVPVVDWSDWLPCDRIAGISRPTDAPPSISMRLAAHPAGWQRQSTLRGAIVDRFAYCDVVPGEHPPAIAFRSGRCAAPWRGNCVAIGDGAVILDPIVDMRLSLAVVAIARLAGLLPAGEDQAAEARAFNRHTVAELDHARDMAAAHYCLNGRGGDPFWAHCRGVAPPDSLAARFALYRDCGRIATMDDDPFSPAMWIATFDALGIRPERHDTLVDLMSADELDGHLGRVRNALVARVAAMPPYRSTVAEISRS